MRRTLCPLSWSVRAKANSRYVYYIIMSESEKFVDPITLDVKECSGIEGAVKDIASSYSPFIIRYRAAKRFGRLVRKQSKIK